MKIMCKSLLVVLVAAVVALTGSISAKAADVSAGADVATAYVFRGATVNDGWVVQPDLSVSNSDSAEWLQPLTLGIWANFDIEDSTGGNPESGQFSEIDLYGSYGLPLNVEDVDMAVGYTEYTYPSAASEDTDADREINLITSFDTLLSPEVAIYWGVDGNLDKTLEFQLTGSHDVPLNADEDLLLNLGGTVSYRVNDNSGPGNDDGFDYVLLSAGLSYNLFVARADFWIETDDKVQPIDGDEVVGVFGIGGDL